MYWKSIVIRKVCLLPNAAKTKGDVKIIVDGIDMSKQLSVLLKEEEHLRVFTDSSSSLELIGCLRQVEKKHIRYLIAYLKQSH